MSGSFPSLRRDYFTDFTETEKDQNALLHFNERLDRKANFFMLNELALEGFLEELDGLVAGREAEYFMTLARICELVLNCAGNYANNGEFSLMGDLLFNPRLVLVHIRGHLRPVVKKRHSLLTDQFKSMADSRYNVMQWLKKETLVEIKTKALLPHLVKQIENSGCLEREYIDSIHDRTRQITELVVFLHSIQISDSHELFSWMNNSSYSDRTMIEAKLFRPNLELFFSLGRRIRQSALIPGDERSLRPLPSFLAMDGN
jgi:hypothetical protein